MAKGHTSNRSEVADYARGHPCAPTCASREGVPEGAGPADVAEQSLATAPVYMQAQQRKCEVSVRQRRHADSKHRQQHVQALSLRAAPQPLHAHMLLGTGPCVLTDPSRSQPCPTFF